MHCIAVAINLWADTADASHGIIVTLMRLMFPVESGRICWRISFSSVVSVGTSRKRDEKRLKWNRYYNLWTRACMCICVGMMCIVFAFVHACMRTCVKPTVWYFEYFVFENMCENEMMMFSAHNMNIVHIHCHDGGRVVFSIWSENINERSFCLKWMIFNPQTLEYSIVCTPWRVQITHFVCVIHFVNFIYKLYDLL